MASGSRGGGRDRRRRGKSPELLKERELMLEVPAPPPKKGRPGPSQTPEERMARVIENAEMRHALVCLLRQLGRVQTSILDSRYGRRKETFGR
ncbi:hypothetical protein R1flu_000289 [Riccia fluitans]|uniref:Uncharacterized protein n=1 Tax=Riccia fluitans TaxID=41844 RepID=A0ABD1Y019_9MARC